MSNHEVASLVGRVEAEVSAAIGLALPEFAGADPVVRRSEHADFQSNAALALAKRARVRPADLARSVAGTWSAAVGAVVGEVSVSGPGFLNLSVTQRAVWEQVRDRLAGARLGVGTPESGQRTVLDYSGPNIAEKGRRLRL